MIGDNTIPLPLSLFDLTELRDYENLDPAARQWAHSREAVPPGVVRRLSGIKPGTTVAEMLFVMREALLAEMQGRTFLPRTFRESRLTPFDEAVHLGMLSCGAMTRMFGVMLRHFGVPVRFVDGTSARGVRGEHHAWLEIFVPSKATWAEFDPAQHSLGREGRFTRLAAYHDWEVMDVEGRMR